MQFKIGNALSGAALSTVLAATLLSGCATGPTVQISEHLPPSPAADFGPEFEVAKGPGDEFSVAGVMDSAGRVHLFVAMEKKSKSDVSESLNVAQHGGLPTTRTWEIHYLVIGSKGVATNEIVRTDVMPPYFDHPESVDLAFDRAGNLHALINNEHLMKRDGVWVGSLRTPWKEAKLNPRFFGSAFVKGTPDLTWSFYMRGSALGLPDVRVWDATVGTAGGGLGIAVFPLSADYAKLLVVPEETPYQHWNALEMEENDSTEVKLLAGDARGAVHVFYTSEHGLRYSNARPVEYMLRYAAFHPDGKCPPPEPGAWYLQQNIALQLPNGTPVCAIRGASIVAGESPATFEEVGPPIHMSSDAVRKFYEAGELPGPDYYEATSEMSYAVDPEFDTMLMANQKGLSLLVADNSREKQPSDMPIKNVGLLLAPAGKHRFHALASGRIGDKRGEPYNPVYYLEFSHEGWSAPVEIGRSSTNFTGRVSYYVNHKRAFKVIGDHDGRALLLWPTSDALVARWVTLKEHPAGITAAH